MSHYSHRYARTQEEISVWNWYNQFYVDLKPDNILLGIEDRAVIDEIVSDEVEEPTPRKIKGSRAIYLSRNFGDLRKPSGRPKIADFGLAVWGNVSGTHNHPIQADLFQAPEVILRAGWTYSADVWNLGVMVSFSLAPQLNNVG